MSSRTSPPGYAATQVPTRRRRPTPRLPTTSGRLVATRTGHEEELAPSDTGPSLAVYALVTVARRASADQLTGGRNAGTDGVAPSSPQVRTAA